MKKVRWFCREVDESVVTVLQNDLNINQIIAKILVGRGITDAISARQYFEPVLANIPDPDSFVDMDKACNRLSDALINKETIGIFGDYDVDGVTSTTILWDFWESVGGKVAATIPDRLLEGYGLNKAGVDRLCDAGAKIIVTVDCGVTAVNEVAYAVSKGIDVIIVDHHTVPVDLPNAVAVINPHRSDCKSDRKHLCAAGVVFNLCMALRRHLRHNQYFGDIKEPNLAHLLDLVALGTVADVVPLIADNRVYVANGLKAIASRRRKGMSALLDFSSVKDGKVTASTLGFQLGPKINAAGRLADAMKAVELLRTNDEVTAQRIAKELDERNKSRRELEKQITQEAIEEIEESKQHQEAHILVVGREAWHPGVVGIVASRIVERFGKPAIVIGQNGKGSGRSIPAFNLHEALCCVSDTLAGFGGHAHACGVHVAIGGLEKFRQALVAHASTAISKDDLYTSLFYDSEVAIEEMDHELIAELSKMGPFGRGNPEPVFRFSNVIGSDMKMVGDNHLRGKIGALQFIAFSMADRMDVFENSCDILAVPEINEWRGYQNIQLRVRDVKSSA